MDKTIQIIRYKVIHCKQLFIISILILFTMFINACGKSKPESTKSKDVSNKSAFQKKNTNISETQIGINLTNVKLSKTSSNQKDNHVEMSKINNIYNSLIYEQKMIELKNTLNRKRKLEEKEKEEIYNNRMKKLLLLYNQYSNNWEAIPNEKDRLSVALIYLCNNIKRQEAIIENLIYSSNPNVIKEATSLMARDRENKKMFNEALEFYKKGEKSILKNNKLINEMNNLTDRDMEALASLYHQEGVMFFMNKNYNELINNFSKCPLLYKNRPLVQANSYLELASAYAKIKDKDKVMNALENAKKTLEKFIPQNDEDKVSLYFLTKDIKEQQNNMQKNVWPDMGWYH